MITRSSVVDTVSIGWTSVALIYFISQAYIVMGVSAKILSTPMIMSLLVIVKNLGEPLFEKILSKYILPDSVVKYVHKYPVLKTMGLVSICSCSLFELVRYIAFGVLCLVGVVGTFALPSTHLAGNLGSLLFRATIGFLLVKKVPLETFLPRMVSRMSKEAAAGSSSAYSLLMVGLRCVLSDPWAGPAEAISPVSEDGAPSSSTTVPQPLRTTKSAAPPTGSAILLAVLLTAAVEAVVLAVALACPLVLDVAEGGQINPEGRPLLMSPARSTGVLFSRPQCALLVAGAVVQCAALVFAAGYLSYRRAIALELRAHASALVSSPAGGSPRSSTSSSSPVPATTTAMPTPPPATGASPSPYSLSAFLLSLLDCDVRLSVCLESSRGGGRMSSVDAFAAGLQSATGVPTTASATASTAAAPAVLPSPSNGHGSGNGKGGGGKAKLSVVIPPAGNGNNAASPRKGSTSTAEKGTSVAQGQVQGQGHGAQYAPQPHMLLVCVMPVLLVAILQTAQTLLRLADTRCSGGNAVAALAAVLLVTFLRDAVPRAALPVAGSQLLPVPHGAAATPQSTKH